MTTIKLSVATHTYFNFSAFAHWLVGLYSQGWASSIFKKHMQSYNKKTVYF